jgi:hypothetical protein
LRQTPPAAHAIPALFASKPAPTDRVLTQVMRLTRAQYRCITQIVRLTQDQLLAPACWRRRRVSHGDGGCLNWFASKPAPADRVMTQVMRQT